ncbi:MAG TPA: hypothetical protein IAA23_00975 [Candidatus Helicobacter avistercoris]|nr:hypothetical protein [Candidatus Helicobacter avistercoris]
MTVSQAKEVIASLAKSQGCYGRMLEEMKYFDKEQKRAFRAFVKPLKSPVDLIMALEG